jgi:hypothetical protein
MSVRELANKNVKVGKVVHLVEAQGAKMGTQQMVVKTVLTDIVLIVVEKEGNM